MPETVFVLTMEFSSSVVGQVCAECLRAYKLALTGVSVNAVGCKRAWLVSKRSNKARSFAKLPHL